MAQTREYQVLLQACTQDGCPLCQLIQEGTRRYLDAWKYELFTDVDIRQELRRTQGFCHTHTWQLVRMGASLPLAQAYRDIITDTIDQLQQSTASTPSAGLLRRLFENKNEATSRSDCPACQQRANAEERYIHSLRQALLDDTFYSSFQSSSGLCLPHFQLATEIHLPEVAGDWRQRLRQAQRVCLERLAAQLEELIRKHDYRFKDEERGPEMRSWRHAAGLVSGEEEM